MGGAQSSEGCISQCIAGIKLAIAIGQKVEEVLEAMKVENEPVEDGNDFDEEAGKGQVHVLLMALDYKQTQNPLSCSIDGKNMEKLLSACGVPENNIRAMYDEQCTKAKVRAAIQFMGSKCRPGDYFVFYYSGHGTNIKDLDGDEADGEDEAFCFVTPDGQINLESCMTDDEFGEVFTSCVDASVQCLILTDCCHSGTICDFGKEMWKGRRAISITGCLDSETSGDIGRGGIFTHSMMQSIGQLSQAGEETYSVGKMYNLTLEKDNNIFNSAQNITLQCAPGIQPTMMQWPLVPKSLYVPPLGQRSLE